MKQVQSFRLDPKHRGVVNKLLNRIDESGVQTPSGLLDLDPVGPFKNQESACRALTGRLVVDLSPEQVWLFGSRARGENSQNADFDVLVVLPTGHPAECHYEQVAAPVIGLGIACDVVPCTIDEFDFRSLGDGSLIGTVKAEGTRLYASPRIRKRERTRT